MKYWAYLNDDVSQQPYSENELKQLPGFGPDLLICSETSAVSAEPDWRTVKELLPHLIRPKAPNFAKFRPKPPVPAASQPQQEMPQPNTQETLPIPSILPAGINATPMSQFGPGNIQSQPQQAPVQNDLNRELLAQLESLTSKINSLENKIVEQEKELADAYNRAEDYYNPPTLISEPQNEQEDDVLEIPFDNDFAAHFDSGKSSEEIAKEAEEILSNPTSGEIEEYNTDDQKTELMTFGSDIQNILEDTIRKDLKAEEAKKEKKNDEEEEKPIIAEDLISRTTLSFPANGTSEEVKEEEEEIIEETTPSDELNIDDLDALLEQQNKTTEEPKADEKEEVKEEVAEEKPAEEQPAEQPVETPAEEVQEQPAEETPVEEKPAEEIVEEQSKEEPEVKEEIAEEKPAEEQPVETPAEEVQEQPAEEAPVEEKPAEEIVEEQPKEESEVKEEIAEEKPEEEQPVETPAEEVQEQPAEETPVEETPAEEQPVEDPLRINEDLIDQQEVPEEITEEDQHVVSLNDAEELNIEQPTESYPESITPEDIFTDLRQMNEEQPAETPAEEVQEQPAEEAPVEETPAEEVQEQPAEEAPVIELPVEEQPVETPAEEIAEPATETTETEAEEQEEEPLQEMPIEEPVTDMTETEDEISKAETAEAVEPEMENLVEEQPIDDPIEEQPAEKQEEEQNDNNEKDPLTLGVSISKDKTTAAVLDEIAHEKSQVLEAETTPEKLFEELEHTAQQNAVEEENLNVDKIIEETQSQPMPEVNANAPVEAQPAEGTAEMPKDLPKEDEFLKTFTMSVEEVFLDQPTAIISDYVPPSENTQRNNMVSPNDTTPGTLMETIRREKPSDIKTVPLVSGTMGQEIWSSPYVESATVQLRKKSKLADTLKFGFIVLTVALVLVVAYTFLAVMGVVPEKFSPLHKIVYALHKSPEEKVVEEEEMAPEVAEDNTQNNVNNNDNNNIAAMPSEPEVPPQEPKTEEPELAGEDLLIANIKDYAFKDGTTLEQRILAAHPNLNGDIDWSLYPTEEEYVFSVAVKLPPNKAGQSFSYRFNYNIDNSQLTPTTSEAKSIMQK